MKSAIDITVPVITFLLLFSVGSDLRIADFGRLRAKRGVVLAGLLLPLVLLPVCALALLELFRPSPAIAMGLLLIAACPIGGISNFYSHLARASTALSIALTALSCVLAVVTIPLLGAAFELVRGEPLELRAPVPLLITQLFLMLVLPVSLGCWVRERRPTVAARYRDRIRRSSFLGLAALLALIIAADPVRFSAEFPVTAPLAAAFVALSFAAGLGTGAALQAGAADRFTLAAEFATRNVGVAATIAVTLLHRVEFATFATIYFLVETPMLLAGVLAFRTRAASTARALP